MCINTYQLIYSSGSCFDHLKVLLNFSEGICTGKNPHIYKYIYYQNTIQQRTASIHSAPFPDQTIIAKIGTSYEQQQKKKKKKACCYLLTDPFCVVMLDSFAVGIKHFFFTFKICSFNITCMKCTWNACLKLNV